MANDNGMGGRRVGKKVFETFYNDFDGKTRSKNYEEDSDYYSVIPASSHMTDWERLIHDYNRDNRFIKNQKRKWLPPKERQLGRKQMKNPTKPPMNDNDEDDGIVMPKKKGSGTKSTKSVSPVMQVMKAVTKAATDLPAGPSKINKKTPQKKGRIDSEDGPSAETKGKA